MKVSKDQAGNDVLVFGSKEVKPKLLEKLNDQGLYYFESYFRRECDGHGVGICGEDISFTFKRPNICFAINRNRNRFIIYEYLRLYSHKQKKSSFGNPCDAIEMQEIEPSEELITFFKQKVLKG